MAGVSDRAGTSPPRRVVLLAGPSGSGKSTIARASGLPVVCLDDFYKDGDDPTLPRSNDLGIVDWDDVRAWHADRALAALEHLCWEGQADLPVYDISQDRATGSQHVDVSSHRAFVAEGVFAGEIVRACREAGILQAALVVRRRPWKNYVRRLARDISERRKSPATLAQRGWLLMRAEPAIVERQCDLGCEPIDAQALRVLLASLAAG